MRGPKAKADPNDEARLSEGMKDYKKLKLNFKSKTEGVVKYANPQREEQVSRCISKMQLTLHF